MKKEKVLPEIKVGKPLISYPNHGFELLQGPSVLSGKILGGLRRSPCTISLMENVMPICRFYSNKYNLFPKAQRWEEHIILLETSEEKSSPEKYRQLLIYLSDAEVFENVLGVLAGKPMDETYAQEYKKLLIEVVGRDNLSIVFKCEYWTCNASLYYSIWR